MTTYRDAPESRVAARTEAHDLELGALLRGERAPAVDELVDALRADVGADVDQRGARLLKACAGDKVSDPGVVQVVFLHGGEAGKCSVGVGESDSIVIWPWFLFETSG